MTLAANLAHIREQIAEACRRAGRAEQDVALMAVSKNHSVESRVQEWQQKSLALTQLTDAEVHLIGPLQSNKTARAVELFHAIDAVDSLKIATRLDAAARTLGKRLPILIEVKLSLEESKHGVLPAELPTLLTGLAPLGGLVPSGLMTVPPWSDDPEQARPYFRELRRLRDSSLAACPTLTQLSMGMSNDFAVAIEEGSTCIRIGTALFGRRQYTAAMS